jgi:hypothetical protein
MEGFRAGKKNPLDRACLDRAPVPEAFLDFLNDTFTNRNQKEIGFIILTRLYGNTGRAYVFARVWFEEIGYYPRDISKAFLLLSQAGLVKRTQEPSKAERRAGEYQFNLPALMDLMKRNTRVLRGIRGRIPKRTIETKNPELKEALQSTRLYGGQAEAVEYIRTSMNPEDQVNALNTIRYMSNGLITPNWRDLNGVLRANSPPVMNIKKELWQANIAGGGKPLYSLDLEACYPNLTSLQFTGRLCPDLYERFMDLLPPGHLAKEDRGQAKRLVNKLLNGGSERYERREPYRRALLEAFGVSNTEFEALIKIQGEARKQAGQVLSLALIMAVRAGYTDLTPVIDCLYTTNPPDQIGAILNEASERITGYELPLKVKQLPLFTP